MQNIAKYIEHTLLKQDATKDQLIKLFDEAKENNFLGVCINPKYVAFAKKYLAGSNVKVVTVVGFPLGSNHTEVKAFETQRAVEDGADEIDMVINITALKDKDYDEVQRDIEAVVKAAKGQAVKVILETDLLDKDEIVKACNICIAAKVKFVKTSTGFVKGGVGAKSEDIKLMYDIVSPHGLEVKASGGVKNKKDAVVMIEEGASRIGTSSGVEIISGQDNEQQFGY